MTSEEIRKKGYTILTNPEQVKDYNIVGQYGTTGAKGSFLYGTPKAGRSLEGTMTEDRGIQPAITETREIPSATNSFANLRTLLAKTTRLAAAEGPSAEDYLNMYASKGVNLDPNAMASALQEGRISRAGMVQDVYKGALDLINEQQTNRQNYMKSVLDKINFVPTAKEYQELLDGNPSPELSQKIQQSEVSDASKGFTLSEGQTRFDAQGNVLASTPKSSKISGQINGKSSLTQAIIDDPSLFDDLTPTNRGKVISELQSNGYDTSNLGVKGLSDTAIKEIAQSQKALEDLRVLRGTVESNLQYVGPITGFATLNPWSKARQVQADVDRVKQTVGKALEGGVLRKEDEEKYKKILATINDTPETALYKIDQLVTSVQKDIENYKSLQQSGGRSLDVRASLQKKSSTVKTGSTSGGNNYTITK